VDTSGSHRGVSGKNRFFCHTLFTVHTIWIHTHSLSNTPGGKKTFWRCREFMEMTYSVSIATRACFQLPALWNSALPQLNNLYKVLALLIHYAHLLSYYCTAGCCQIYDSPTHLWCSYEHSGSWWILEFGLDFCALIIVHLLSEVGYIEIICNLPHPPPPPHWQKECRKWRNEHRLLMRRCTKASIFMCFFFMMEPHT